MTIDIQDLTGQSYQIDLESNGDSNDNGIEFSYFGEIEDSNGNILTVQISQHRNHPTVSEENIEMSDNIQTSRRSIADQINEQLSEE